MESPFRRLPSSIKKIEQDAFNGCKNLQTIILPEELESIRDRWFENTSIKEIIIPKNVKTIGNYAFSRCKNLTVVILQEKLKHIGKKCFC